MNFLHASNNELRPADLHGVLRYVKSFRGETFIIGIENTLMDQNLIETIHREIDVLQSLNIKILLFYYASAEEMLQIQPSEAFKKYFTTISDFQIFNYNSQSKQSATEEINALLATKNLCVLDGFKEDSASQCSAFFPLIMKGIHAQKLILIVNHTCPIIDGEPLTNIAASELENVFNLEILGEIPEWFKLHSKIAIQAITSNIERVHLLNGNIHNALLNELFDKVGIGTMIHSNNYETIREATINDVQALYHLTQNSVKRETLLKRSIEDIRTQIEHYFVYEIDGSIVACTCIEYFEKEQAVEIGSVFVQPYYNGRGIGRRLVQKACDKSKTNGYKKAFIITANAENYFLEKCGFKRSHFEELPKERKLLFEKNKRNSSILKKVF